MDVAFVSFCTFVKNEFRDAKKIKACIAGYVDEVGAVLSFARNTFDACAERNLLFSGYPSQNCFLVVVRLHINSHGVFIKTCRPCGKCVDFIHRVPINIKYTVWSDHSGFVSSLSSELPDNSYRAHNATHI